MECGEQTYDEWMEASARAYLRNVLDRTDGNVSAAARIAGRYRTNFHALLVRYGVKHPNTVRHTCSRSTSTHGR